MRGERGPVQVLCCGALLLWGTRRSLVSEPASSQLGWQCPQLAREQRPQLISLFTALDSSLFCCFAHVLMPLTPPAGSPPGIPPTALSALPTSPDTAPTTHTHTHTRFSTALLPCLFSPQPACQSSSGTPWGQANPFRINNRHSNMCVASTNLCICVGEASCREWVQSRTGEKWAEGWAGCSLGM